MERLLAFPLIEPSAIAALRRTCSSSSEDDSAKIALGVALSSAGCTYEAAAILRPLRAKWKATQASDQARHALDAQAWWNKHWRDFARAKQAGDRHRALSLLGDRAVWFWDLPPLLIHLGDFALADDKLELASHLYQRVRDLSQSGLPKMNLAPFEYVAEASLIEVALRSGKAADALTRHRALTPNPGNAMAHELQHIRLLVATEALDEAMRHAASVLVTAEKHRSGYSKTVRQDFIDAAPELAPLRARDDWGMMITDPAAYLRKR